MSSAPNLPQIQDAIVTALTITAGVGSYNYTIPAAAISLIERDIKSVMLNGSPSVTVAYQGNDEPRIEPGEVRERARFLITTFVPITETEPQAAAVARMLGLSRIKDDIKAALLGASSLHGGVACFVTFGEADSTAAQDAERGGGPGQGTGRFMLYATYYEPRGLTPVLA